MVSVINSCVLLVWRLLWLVCLVLADVGLSICVIVYGLMVDGFWMGGCCKVWRSFGGLEFGGCRLVLGKADCAWVLCCGFTWVWWLLVLMILGGLMVLVVLGVLGLLFVV